MWGDLLQCISWEGWSDRKAPVGGTGGCAAGSSAVDVLARSNTSCSTKSGLWCYILLLCAAVAEKMLTGLEPGTQRGRDFTPAIPGFTKTSGTNQLWLR